MKHFDKVNKFFSGFPSKKLSKNTIILSPDEKLLYVYFLKSGYVRSYTINQEGSEYTLNIFKPNSFFPMPTILSGEQNSYYFETISNAEINLVPISKVLNFLRSENEILFDLLRRISIGLESTLTRMQFMLTSNSGQKVAWSLYLMARRFGAKDGPKSVKITLPQTHEDIAMLSGLTRETTSIVINNLCRENIIERNGRFTIVKNMPLLKKRSSLIPPKHSRSAL